MHHGKLLTIPCFVILFVCPVLPDSARADAGDKILRASLSYVNPTADARLGGTGIQDFLDPTNPPMVRFDVTEDHRIAADSNVGVGLDFEVMVTDRVGIDASPPLFLVSPRTLPWPTTLGVGAAITWRWEAWLDSMPRSATRAGWSRRLSNTSR